MYLFKCLMWLSCIPPKYKLTSHKTSSGYVLEDRCSLQIGVYNHSIVSKARCTKSLSPLSINSAGSSWDSEQESTALNYCACMYVNLQHGDHSVVHLFMEAEIVFTLYTAHCRIHTNTSSFSVSNI